MSRDSSIPRRNLRAEGSAHEDQAAEYLIALGYTIVTRRFVRAGGEIDLVALDGNEIVFVEVKARGPNQALPEEVIGPKKVAALRRVATKYLQEAGEMSRIHRFDLVAIDPDGVRHHQRFL